MGIRWRIKGAESRRAKTFSLDRYCSDPSQHVNETPACRRQFSPMRREDSVVEKETGERETIEQIPRFGSRLVGIRQEKWRQAKELLAIGRARFRRNGLARFGGDEGELVGSPRR